MKIKYSSLLNDNQAVSGNSGLMFLKLMSKCHPSIVKIYGMDGFKYNAYDNYSSDDMFLANEKETIDNLNLGMSVELSKFKDLVNIDKVK